MLMKIVVVIFCSVIASATEPNYYVTDKVLFPTLPNGAIQSQNTVCLEESKLYKQHLDNLTLWAHESKLKIIKTCFFFNLYFINIFMHG